MHTSLPPSQEQQDSDLKQIQAATLAAHPLQPVTLPVVPPTQLSIDNQQAHLIRELGNLNTRTDDLMHEQPSLEAVYQQKLAEIFPELPRPINPNSVFYSRYRVDNEGQKQLLSCEPLGPLLKKIRAPGGEAYLTETGAFYRERNTLEADKSLSATASPATLASVLEIAITMSLNEFWGDREDEQPNTEEQLVALRRQVLAHQLALRTVDGTLSAAGRTLADNLLKYPDAAAREKAFTAGNRPGVYRLTLEDGSEFAAAFILNATGGASPAGNVMLYSPGEGFEEYENLSRLNETVAARLRDGGSAGKLLASSLPATTRAQRGGLPVLAVRPPPIDADVIADSVRSLRIRQHFRIREALRGETLPVTGELDLAADLTPQLDACIALAARNLRLVEPHEPGWLAAASPVDQARYRQLEKAMIDSNEVLIPLLEKISTLTSFSEIETHKALKIQKPAYADVHIAPYRSLVHLRLTATLAFEVRGYRDEETEVVYISEDPKIDIPQFLKNPSLKRGSWKTTTIVDLRTLGSYTRRNVDPWSVHEVHRTISATADIIDFSGKKRGRLDNADLRALAQQANIAEKYETYLKSAFSQSGNGGTFATAWQRAHTVKMNKDALESRLNPAAYNLFVFKTPGSGFDWIQSITEHPDSATRPKVSGFEIEGNLLVMGSALEEGQGGQVINGVSVIQRKGTGTHGVSVLYTPDAPDGVPFRELVDGLAELDTLKTKPEWRTYLTQRMATNDAQELARIFSDTRSVHRYALIPITGNFQAYLYSAQLGFQLARADYRSRSNEEISRESTVNAFMFAAEVADFLIDLVPAKAVLSFLRRGIIRALHKAQKLGHLIPGLVNKVSGGRKAGIAIGKISIRPLEPAWVNVAEYRLPKQIDPLFDVELFAQTNNYTLSRSAGRAPSFIDTRNNQFIAMRDERGRYHLYSSYQYEGARYIKDPAANKVDFMVVPDDAKSWKPRFERRLRGGGPVWSALRPLTAAQQVDNDLIAALRVYSTEEEIPRFIEDLVKLSNPQKKRLLDTARQQLDVNIDEATFRRIVSDPRGLSQTAKTKLRDSLLTLQSDMNIFVHINKSTNFSLPLTPEDIDKLHIRIKRIIGKNDDFSKSIRASIGLSDPETGARLVGYAFTQKHINSLTKFDQKHKLSTWPIESLNNFLNEKGRQQILNKIAADKKITRQEALDLLLESPEIQDTLEKFRAEKFIEQLRQLGVDSFSEDFKKSGVPYIALSRGKPTGSDSGVKMVDSVTVTNFERNITQFSSPLEFVSPRAQTHRIERPVLAPDIPAVPTQTAVRAPTTNIVKLDDLAETQIPLLPDNARAKIEDIIQDIQAGRVTRKKIGKYTYVDLPQVEIGAGRGRWRAAFEKAGKDGENDIFILRGIIDYHASKPVAWGM
ncbi:hypothetical protein GNF76_00455 [Pseudomonas sp. CCM 7893]|uniref:Dermonecrotic toxin N-terminal domain-containing protein n=1 Tax=Pseudomonas spelaei TaxID=1055469 RepID=A0A6I3W6I5_9PSED|nr:DUF6543 domain-containing protein [Pseudomonas spelaei]MUF02782.1 hypothetical protein [Pseudomonas spelaei]